VTENEISRKIIGAAMSLHTELGPGLLESAYQVCFGHELRRHGLDVREQVSIPIHYRELTIDNGYRIDLLLNESVVVELKSVEVVLPVHRGQLLSCLRLGRFKLGYLLNFNVAHMRDGITRLVNGL
jgi:GxxExxY protein